MAASERSPKSDTPQIDTELVRELASILKDAELGEIEIEHGELRIRVSTASALAPPAPMPQQMAYVQQPSAPAPTAAAPVHAESATTAEARSAPQEGTIPSPMVGTVYLSPEPGASAFVTEGKAVRKGDTLMLVEAMKTFNPVTAPVDGTVKAILVSDGQPVEYGEPLIVVA